ncbi:MAG: hypothetical protein ACEQSX_10735 [Baekduiaceae bacterium]
MSLLRETYAAEARAEWANLLAMAAQPGRRVLARTVRRLGRAAGVDAAEVALAIVTTGAVS